VCKCCHGRLRHPSRCDPQAEKAKRAARAAKFGRQQTLVYAPDPEEMRKAERAAKFGTSYHADGALMDMGEVKMGWRAC
jgi:hypothetical protein